MRKMQCGEGWCPAREGVGVSPCEIRLFLREDQQQDFRHGSGLLSHPLQPGQKKLPSRNSIGRSFRELLEPMASPRL